MWYDHSENTVYWNFEIACPTTINNYTLTKAIIQFKLELDGITPDFNSFKMRFYTSVANKWSVWKSINVTSE